MIGYTNGTFQYIKRTIQHTGWYRLMYWSVPFRVSDGTVL